MSIHPFEASGLGLAPFRYVGFSVNEIRYPDGHAQPGGTCNHCGTGIKFEFHVESSDGRRSIVGSDCVKKLQRIDNVLVGEVERARLNYEREIRQQKQQAAWEADRPIREARQARAVAQHEERERLAAEALAVRTARYTVENAWLVEVLRQAGGDFCTSVARDLERQAVGDLSDRCLAIVADIYAKSFGRGGSKTNKAAREAFWGRVEADDATPATVETSQPL